MDFYVSNNGASSGPFPEEQVRQMIAMGTVNSQTLAWRPGESQWRPLSYFLPGLSLPPPVPLSAKSSVLGLISLIYGIVSIFGWLLVFVITGIGENQGSFGMPQQTFYMLVGTAMMMGCGLNVVATILGIVGTVQSGKSAVSIVGILLNVLQICGVIALIIYGLSLSHGS